jgi:Berberine and berberine like
MVAPPMPFLPAEAHGELVIMVTMVYAGEVGKGERAIAPFRSLAKPLVDTVGPKPYPEMYEPMGPGPDEEVARSLFIDSFNRDVAQIIVEHLRASTAPMAVAQLRVLGGAMARVPAEATAFAHRERRIMVALGAVYERPEETAEHENWVTRFAAALDHGDGGVYVNFLGDEGDGRVRAAYPGSTWDRLAEIKGRFDPTNLFSLNQNIPPANERRESGVG